MTRFEMVKYHNQEYPENIPLRIEEIAAHFDIQEITGLLGYSLHTEYSYGKRSLNNPLITKYPEITAAQKDGVPQLWKNSVWALQFADFITELTGDIQPKVIEIHPPFNDYTDIEHFIASYSAFEDTIKNRFPEAEILIENRCGSVYHGGRFLISKLQEVTALCDQIGKKDLSLRIAYDVPQIYTAHHAEAEKAYTDLLKQTRDLRCFIGGVHLWGKRLSGTGRKVSHCGDLSSYFGNDSVKASFLQTFRDCFDDDHPRKMVLEVNSGNEDLRAIIADLQSTGIVFN